MKVQNKKSPSYKKKILLAIAILVGIAGVSAYAFYRFADRPNSSIDTNKVNYNKPTSPQVTTGNQIKSNAASGTSSDTPPAPTPQSDSSQSIVQISVTSAVQTDSTYNIRSLISTVTNSGTCTLTLTQGSSKVIKTSNVQAEASTSTCEGFNIPLSELSSGTWQLVLGFSNSMFVGSTTSTITVT